MYNNLNDKPNIDKNIQKSRTCQDNENFNRVSFTLRLNNLGQNHLETVLEAVGEASDSKFDSSKISGDAENDKGNKNNIKNETKESLKIKEESGNLASTKIQGTETKNDSENNFVKKKSL